MLALPTQLLAGWAHLPSAHDVTAPQLAAQEVRAISAHRASHFFRQQEGRREQTQLETKGSMHRGVVLLAQQAPEARGTEQSAPVQPEVHAHLPKRHLPPFLQLGEHLRMLPMGFLHLPLSHLCLAQS